jgi:hypothetical protein
MTEEKAKARVNTLNAMVKHATLNYRVVKLNDHTYGVGQFLGDQEVARVN